MHRLHLPTEQSDTGVREKQGKRLLFVCLKFPGEVLISLSEPHRKGSISKACGKIFREENNTYLTL